MLQDYFPGIVSYYAASKKTKQGILFLYTIIKGVADGSFGIEVAKLAQLPDSIIVRAKEVLKLLAASEEVQGQSIAGSLKIGSKQPKNISLEQENAQLKGKIQDLQEKTELLEGINFGELSPKQAFDLLWKFKEKQ